MHVEKQTDMAHNNEKLARELEGERSHPEHFISSFLCFNRPLVPSADGSADGVFAKKTGMKEMIKFGQPTTLLKTWRSERRCSVRNGYSRIAPSTMCLYWHSYTMQSCLIRIKKEVCVSVLA